MFRLLRGNRRGILQVWSLGWQLRHNRAQVHSRKVCRWSLQTGHRKKGRWWDKQTCHEHIKGDTNMWIHDANAVTTYHDSSISGSRGGGIKDASVWQEVEGWSAFPIGWGNGQSGNPFFQGKFTKAVKIYCMCEKYSTRGVVKNDPKHNSGQASDLCGPEVSDVGNWGGWMSMYGPKMLNANQEYTFYCANNEKGAGIIFTAA